MVNKNQPDTNDTCKNKFKQEAECENTKTKCQENSAEYETEPLEKKYEELNERFMRLAAEYENYRKRSTKEKEQIYLDAVAGVVSQFLSVIDSLEAALTLKIPDSEFKKGIELVYGNCLTALKNLGVKTIEEAGEKFDPNIHNAVLHINDDSNKENEVVEILQKGYSIAQKIIRHAMVKVSN
ncbi:MAG: nucleotide exchange factor GrpE [Oscillospiraceae bacterium]|jgi:molecular chaperone GrpE|nr:nucleotide exchange factor GrpE [Oscillospiraceae bacterium]